MNAIKREKDLVWAWTIFQVAAFWGKNNDPIP